MDALLLSLEASKQMEPRIVRVECLHMVVWIVSSGMGLCGMEWNRCFQSVVPFVFSRLVAAQNVAVRWIDGRQAGRHRCNRINKKSHQAHLLA